MTWAAHQPKARPATAHVTLYDVTYAVDLEACRVRLLERVAELGAALDARPHLGPLSDEVRDQLDGFRRKGGMQLVANAAGVDRATLRRFLRGERLSVETFTAIITRGLRLDMHTVVRKAAA